MHEKVKRKIGLDMQVNLRYRGGRWEGRDGTYERVIDYSEWHGMPYLDAGIAIPCCIKDERAAT